MKRVIHRKAIAMVELIFAIVIMAIVLMSAPTLINQSVKSGYMALQQESVNILASQVNLLLTKEWDRSNTDSQIEPVVLTVSNGNLDLEMVTLTTARRIGTPVTSSRAFISSMRTDDSVGAVINAVSTNQFGEGKDSGGTLNDIDDYNDKITTLIGDEDALAGGNNYIDLDISLTTKVTFGNDDPAGDTYKSSTVTFNHPFNGSRSGTTNIKLISVLLETTTEVEELKDKKIRLSAFMCNIGHYKLETPRDYE